jgi:hypothetical protein
MHTKLVAKLTGWFCANFALLGLTLTTAVAQPVPLVPRTQFWQYNDQSVDLGTAWSAKVYDDSTWSNGIPALGFRSLNNTNYPLPGGNIVRTLLRKVTPTNGAVNIMTFYFRTHFTFTNNPGGMTLTASNLIDDGAIFYINGREITRHDGHAQ